jgi:hypothetical protein
MAENIRPSAQLTSVTPKLAAQWLAKNQHNRNVRTSVVNAYARDMIAGNWQVTGEALKFDTEGDLIDGQHRLQAVIKADVTVTMLVVRGIAATAQDVMDTGAKRSASDALQLHGHANSTTLAAAARLALMLDLDSRANADTRNRRSNSSFTNSEVKAYVDRHPELHDGASKAAAFKKSIDLNPSVMAVAWTRLAAADPERAETFFDSIANNSTGGAGDPRSTLIKRLASARRNGERLSQGTQLALVIRAWNAWCRGERVTNLRIAASVGRGESVAVSIPKVWGA